MPVAAQTPDHADLTVYDGVDFRCTSGVNLGEAFCMTDAPCLGDAYRLTPWAEPRRIALTRDGDSPRYTLTQPLDDLPAGIPVTPGPRLTLMRADARLFSVRVLTVADRTLLVPLGRFDMTSPLDLICSDRDHSPLPVSDPTTLAFGRGTRITLSDGTLRPVEALRPGDLILTRDGRSLPLRSSIAETGPALGSAARVIIREGAFANDRELVVSAAHHLLVPGRRNDLDPAAPDRVLPAWRLVNDLTVTLDSIGQAEWFHLVLDRHDFIFAEGIPCESLCLTEAARAGLSPDPARHLAQTVPDLVHSPHPLSLAPQPRSDTAAASAPIRPHPAHAPSLHLRSV